jgi:protein-disulfide isomerase
VPAAVPTKTTSKSSRPAPRRTPPPPSNRNRLLLIAAPLLAIVLVGALIAGQQLTQGSGRPQASKLQFVGYANAQFAGLPQHGGVVGYPDAPVTIRMYGDPRCPTCRYYDTQIMPDLITRLVRTHKARLDFRPYVILGPNSVTASRAEWAAAQQDRAWPWLTLVYANQGSETVNWFDTAFADAAASGVGLDVGRYDRDRRSAASLAAIKASYADATHRGLSGTPSFVVVGPHGARVVPLGTMIQLPAVERIVAQASR